jgi:alkanesulfonate monooxygenase SsuD/methylene tetrahydromethanopterin reductase-like flavin-dependent oxidoreductase (luciferase family)
MRGLWRIWPTKRPRWAKIDEPSDPKPHPPVRFGGNALAGMRRAAHYGNGFMGAGSQTTSRYAEQVAMVKDELAAQNRDPETFRFGKRVNVHVEEDPTIARTLDYALRHHYGGGEWADHTLAGTAKECVAGIRAVADAGADLILLNPLVPQLFRGAGGDPALKNIDALGWPSTIAGHCSRLQSLENRVCMGPDLSV